ncbi:MAG: tyrosine-type recombinase/integrase [Bacteroidota bacterium]
MGRPKRHLPLESTTYLGYIAALENYLTALGYNASVVRQHGRQLRRFLSWLEGQGVHSIQYIDPPVLLAYRSYLKTQPSLNDGGSLHGRTIYSHLRTVQLLYDYLLETGQTSYDPLSQVDLEYPKLQARRAVLTPSAIRQLYGACQTRRERALLGLTYGCGLRAGELEAVNVVDVHFKTGILIVPRGKHQRRRLIPLSEGVRRDLLLYHLSQVRYTEGAKKAFLLNDRARRMRRYTANKWLRKLSTRAGLEQQQICVHVLRHSIATHLLENGSTVDQVRVFLGHRHLKTTEVYTHVEESRLEQLRLA